MTTSLSNSNIGTNLKPRELWCPRCKTTVVNDKADALCDQCGAGLITVIKKHELATPVNKPT